MLFWAIFFVFNSFNSATATDTPFRIGIRLLKPTIISETRPLSFYTLMQAGSSSDLKVSSKDDTAAEFNIAGNANRNIDTKVVEDHIVITTPRASKPIVIDHFTVKAPIALNSQGRGTISAGGTAHIGADSENGTYMGAATLRVVYQ